MSSEASTQRLRLLAGIAADLLAAERPDQVTGDLCARIHANLGLDTVLYYALEDSAGRKTLTLRSHSGLRPEAAAGIERLDASRGLCGLVAARGTPTIVDAAHPRADPDDRLLTALGLPVVACHPLIGPEGVVGTLLFGRRSRRPLDDEELWVMATVASLVVLAIGKSRAALALEETESRLALANRAAGQGLWEIDLSTAMVTLSDKARELFGVPQDAPQRRRAEWRQLILPDDRPSIMSAIDNARAGTDYHAEFRIRRPSDGGVRWIAARGRLLPGTTRLVGVLSDVTEARAAAEAQRRTLVESERSLRALREKEELLRLAMLAARGGVFIYHTDTETMELSPEAATLLGLPKGTATLTKTDALARVDAANQVRIERVVLEATTSDAVVTVDFEVRLPGGGKRTVASFSQHDPRRHRIVGFLMDVSERCAAEEALREGDRRKSEFIAILSHELRNPLTPIVYALPVIERNPHDAEAAHALTVVRRQLGHLGRLVDDLLDISRINSGKVELRREVVPIQQILEAVVESTASLVQASRHRLEVTLPEAPLPVEADPHRLAQVLTNLLTNATRYTPRGGRISLGARQEDGRAVVRVRDTGVGIPAKQMPRLFEMFQQIHPEEGMRGGLGIGLALARRLITMHGGTIEAFSEGAGKGAEFVITLPLARAPAVRPPPPGPVPRSATPLRVLIVDDNVDLVEMLATIVAGQGHQVQKALDGPSALITARAFRPEVVLLDLGLPFMSGLEVARRLRAEPRTRDAHLIALTGWGQDEDRRRTREAGIDEHLTKPTDPDVLMRMLNEIAAKRNEP